MAASRALDLDESHRGQDHLRWRSGGKGVAEHRPCPICENQAEYVADRMIDTFCCPCCGNFDYDTTTWWRKSTSPDEMVRLSGWVREMNDAGIEYARITPEISRLVADRRLPRLQERAMRALAHITRKFHESLD